MQTRASLLCIGTELTTGQTLNSNSQWISDACSALGIEMVEHSTIADDREQILNSIERLAQMSDLLFVTGGLGPTTDDFTRNVLAEWSGKPLEFNETSWKKIETRLKERGVEVAPSNKQQCYFPQSSVILTNNEGTADAFRFVHKSVEIVVLPGPPREGRHIWQTHIEKWLKSRFVSLTPEILLKWKCLGKSEAALGEIVEAALEGSGFKTGYRASPPYVEVKVWLPHGTPTQNAHLEKLEQAIESWVVTRNDEDLARFWFNQLLAFFDKKPDSKFLVIDQGSDGVLAQRLFPIIQNKQMSTSPLPLTLMTDWSEQMMKMPTDTLVFILAEEGIAQLIGGGQALSHKIESPYNSPLMLDRLRKYQVEKALQFWAQSLAENFA